METWQAWQNRGHVVEGIGGAVHELTPDWEAITKDVLFGQVWQDPRLSKRDRSLVTVALLMAQRADTALAGHLHRALAHGVTVEELKALITHAVMYGGWPTGEHAIRILHAVLQESRPYDQPCRRACCTQ